MSGAKMCKEKAAISQLEALGWVWVDDARWAEPEPRKYENEFDLYIEAKRNKEWLHVILHPAYEMKRKGYSSTLAEMAAVKAAQQFYPEMGFARDHKGWYLKDPEHV